MRSKFLEGGKVLSLFYAIIKQFDILSESHDIDFTVGYKNMFNLCLNVSIIKFKVIYYNVEKKKSSLKDKKSWSKRITSGSCVICPD